MNGFKLFAVKKTGNPNSLSYCAFDLFQVNDYLCFANGLYPVVGGTGIV